MRRLAVVEPVGDTLVRTVRTGERSGILGVVRLEAKVARHMPIRIERHGAQPFGPPMAEGCNARRQQHEDDRNGDQEQRAEDRMLVPEAAHPVRKEPGGDAQDRCDSQEVADDAAQHQVAVPSTRPAKLCCQATL